MAASATVALALALIYIRWRREGFDWPAFAAAFLDLDWRWVLYSALFALATYYGRALRWGVMLRRMQPNPSVWRLFSATAIGFTAVVLFGRPGEFVRPYLIALRERLSFSSQLALWLLERIYDLLAALVIFAFALSQIDRTRAAVGPGLEWVLRVGGEVIGVTGLACVVILVMLRHYSEVMKRRLLAALAILPGRFYRKAEELVSAFVEGAQVIQDRTALMMMLVYTGLEWGLIAACYFCLFRAFPALGTFPLASILIFMGFVSFGSVVQIPGIGGGMQVVAVLVLTELFHLPLELATSVAVMVWILTFVVVVPVGLLLLFHDGIGWQKLKQIEAEASL